MTSPASASLTLINARLLCPASRRDEIGGIRIENGIIADTGPHLATAPRDSEAILDCRGHLLIPGLIDMQVFTGEPGAEHRETLATASQAAAAGGVTTLIVMPDTNPVIDDVAIVDFIKRAARDTAAVHIYPMAALTKQLQGREMSEIGLLKAAGAVAFSNGKTSIADAKIMRLLLSYAKDLGALVAHFPEDPSLARGGVINEGEIATRLGLPSIPCEAETIMVERDVRLAALTGGRYHATTLSCAASADVIRRAKAAGLAVTCGVAVNNLTLTEADVGSYRTFLKVKPPLRQHEDRLAMIAAVADGTVDVIVSNHDPQDVDVKRRPFEEAADGAIGLETLLVAALECHHAGEIAIMPLIAAMTANPARLLDLPAGRLETGLSADITVVALDAPRTLDAKKLRSKSRNSPHDGVTFRSRVAATFAGGRLVYRDAEIFPGLASARS